MYRLRMESCLMLGAALLAGCSDRNTLTAPSAHPLAATASVVDGQLYEWSVKCSGELSSYASSSWKTPLGTTGAISKTCSPSASPITLQAVRPAAADSFSACVNGTCQKWAVDPARTFTAQLKGSSSERVCYPSFGSRRGHCYQLHAAATLNVADLTGSTTGDVQVTTSTTGTGTDPDGYTVAVDGGAGQPLAANGTVTFSQVIVGDHSVALSGIAPNCAMSGQNPATVTVTSGATAQATFQIACTEILAIDAVAGFSSTTNTNSSTWSYRYQNGSTRDGNYFLLPEYGPDVVETWTPTDPDAWRVQGYVPALGVNRTGSDATIGTGLTWRNGTMLVHPGAAGLVVLSWLSPSEATAAISFTFSDLDTNCFADGIDWFVERNNEAATLSSGSLNDGGSSGPLSLTGVPVHVGDRINFIVGPRSNYYCDSTQLIASIATTAP